MALPYSFLDGGTFAIPALDGDVASAIDVQVMGNPDRIVARSITGWGESGDAQAIEWWWDRSMGNGFANGILQSSEASTPQLPAMTAYRLPATGTTPVDAIWVYDTTNPPVFAGLANTTITGNAGTFIVTMANTGTIAIGDYVRLVSPTGELQIGGYAFQVTAVSNNANITLGYMASAVSAGGLAVFAANASAGTVYKYIPSRFYPRKRFIAMITKAAQAVVYFTTKNDFTPGEIVSFRVPTEYGMKEINNKQVRVLSVTNSATVSSITIDLDTTGYTTFAFPTSAIAAAGVTPAMCFPSSSGVVPFNGSATIPQQPPGTNLLDSFDNRNVQLIHFGAALFNVSSHVSAEADVWAWEAYKMDNYVALATI